MLAKTLLRVANEEYARQNGSVGLTTMKDKHVEVNGSTLIFEFRAKSGIQQTIDLLAEWARPREPDIILGAEARGFIFGGALAYELGCGFVAARKP